jgi:hypothetical protein
MKNNYSDGGSSGDGKVLVDFLYTVPMDKLSKVQLHEEREQLSFLTPVKEKSNTNGNCFKI